MLNRLLFSALVLLLPVAGFQSSKVGATPSESLSQSASVRSMIVEAKYAHLDGARIHYLSYGTGNEALVLIHGWTMNVDNWSDSNIEFAKRNRVIEIDLPGHGKSDKPQVTYSMDYFARAVDAVLKDANVKRAVLVGHSMGTPIARQFYRKYPKKTLAIVIVDGGLRPFPDTAMVNRLVEGLRGPGYRDLLKQMFSGMSGSGLSAEAKARIDASSQAAPQYVLVSAMEGMIDSSIWGEDKINVPVLALMTKNPLFPPNIEESYKALAPNMEFHMWEAGHFIMMEKPKEFNEAVLAFLDKNKLLKK